MFVSLSMSASSYTAVYNLIGCPAGILPVTRESDEDQAALEADYPHTDANFRLAREAARGATGLPLGVQVIGRHYQEEMVLHVMRTIENLVQRQNHLE